VRSAKVISFVYVIGAMTPRGAKTYVGWTVDPDRRLEQHNNGKGAKSTRGEQWQLLYAESMPKNSLRPLQP